MVLFLIAFCRVFQESSHGRDFGRRQSIFLRYVQCKTRCIETIACERLASNAVPFLAAICV